MIPTNIKREHIIRAIEEAQEHVIPVVRDSQKYYLEYGGKLYPPKYIISLANKFPNGSELKSSEFSGGHESNNFLESLGFAITEKLDEKRNFTDNDHLDHFLGLETAIDSNIEQESIWVVRAGKEGQQERSAIENNVVTIGWNTLPDLLSFKDKRELEQFYLRVEPYSKKMKIAINVGQMWSFTHRIKKGDLVILPLKSQPTLAVAKVLGDYEYQDDSDYLKHIRRVRWLTIVPRKEIDHNLMRSIDTPMTVFKIEKNDARNRMIKYIKMISPIDRVDTEMKEHGREVPKMNSISSIEQAQKDNLIKLAGANKSPTLFKQINYTVSKLIDDIKIGEIGLPDLQRPFVWNSTKVRDLFDSMYKGFPVGYLLFWSNRQAKEPRTIGVDNKQKLPDLLIIDGQQRLTLLFTVLTGEPILDEDYNKQNIKISFKPRDGIFDVADISTRRDPERWVTLLSGSVSI